MSFNGAQRRILLAGLILLVTRGVIPPWKVSFIGGHFGPYGWSEGFGFLLRPPSPSLNAYQYNAFHLQVDWSLLLQLCLVTVLMTAGICLVFMKHAEESDTRFFKMLETRKFLSSLIIGVGFPIPLLGIPAAYYWASLLVNGVGFESGGMLVISVSAFVGLTVLCLLFSSASSNREIVRCEKSGDARCRCDANGCFAGRSVGSAKERARPRRASSEKPCCCGSCTSRSQWRPRGI
jgi:hypothetical protein